MGSDVDPICIVPARGTEPSFPKRNFKRLDGKPLVAHTIETARSCPALGEVVVSTESAELAEVAREYGASVPFLRPERLADWDVLLHEVIEHAVSELESAGRTVEPDTPVVVLQPNVPFRRPRSVAEALETFESGHEAVVSVVEEDGLYWRRDGEDRLEARFEERTVRSELEPFYRETGSINVTTPRLLAEGTRVGESPGYVVTDRLSALSVDSVLDLWLAERVADGPRIAFRVDGGGDLGMGHVYRCLTLADELSAALRCEFAFVSDAAFGAGVETIQEAGYDVRAVGGGRDPLDAVAALDPDLVFLDVLDTDAAAVRRLHETAAAIVNLEDTGGGIEQADFVVNAFETDRPSSNHLTGAEYFVLREEFRPGRPPVETVDRVLLTFGGSDPADVSTLACRAAALTDGEREYRLVLGPDYGDRTDLDAALADCPAVTVLEAVEDMGTQMRWADLAVASGGRTAYELSAVGTPTLVVAQNDREHERMRALDAEGVIEYLGRPSVVSPADLAAAMDALAADTERRRRLSERSRAYVDGRGTRRILDLVHDLLLG
jgi:spore coat polysaccharide biosynthesis predicted glycosyltransferase SpsG/CMP-N-acetylneuraminic acid synthetase